MPESPSHLVPRARSKARSVLFDGSWVFALAPVDVPTGSEMDCRIHNLQTGPTSVSTVKVRCRRPFSVTLADSTPTQVGVRWFLSFA